MSNTIFEVLLLNNFCCLHYPRSCKVYYSLSARIFNIYPKKGAILAGSDADIIILNPNASFEISSKHHHSRTDTNVYEGKKGKVEASKPCCSSLMTI